MKAIDEINAMVKEAAKTLAGLNLPASAYQPLTQVPDSVKALPMAEYKKYWAIREQNSPLKKIKPINWFNEKYQTAMNGPAPSEAPKTTATAPRPAVASARPSASADPKIMPLGAGIRGSGWTGRQVVQGGSAPVSRVQQSELRPFNALHKMENPQQLAQLPYMKMQSRMNAEGAAYDEILKRLNAKGGDRNMNMQYARRLAPMVAKNYRRQADGSWKAISPAGAAQATQVARKMTPATAGKV